MSANQRITLNKQQCSGVVQVPGGRLTVIYNSGEQDALSQSSVRVQSLTREAPVDLLEILYSYEAMEDEGTRITLIEALPRDIQESLKHDRPRNSRAELTRIVQYVENRCQTGDFAPLSNLVTVAKRVIGNPQLRVLLDQYLLKYSSPGRYRPEHPEWGE